MIASIFFMVRILRLGSGVGSLGSPVPPTNAFSWELLALRGVAELGVLRVPADVRRCASSRIGPTKLGLSQRGRRRACRVRRGRGPRSPLPQLTRSPITALIPPKMIASTGDPAVKAA